jgi:uncharacterized protein (DUF1015 family)
MIMDYNRVVKDLNGLTNSAFLDRLEEIFEVHKIGEQAQYPAAKGEISMYLFGVWYRLTIRPEYRSNDPSKRPQ